MTPRTQKTIDIFLDALNEGTLAKGTCSACACGNIVAAHMGIKASVPKTFNEYATTIYPNTSWVSAISTIGCDSELVTKNSVEEILSTGFTIKEFYLIERTFEANTKIHFDHYSESSKEEIRQDQLKGLTAVVELLLRWDESETNVQQAFVEKAELVPIK